MPTLCFASPVRLAARQSPCTLQRLSGEPESVRCFGPLAAASGLCWQRECHRVPVQRTGHEPPRQARRAVTAWQILRQGHRPRTQFLRSLMGVGVRASRCRRRLVGPGPCAPPCRGVSVPCLSCAPPGAARSRRYCTNLSGITTRRSARRRRGDVTARAFRDSWSGHPKTL